MWKHQSYSTTDSGYLGVHGGVLLTNLIWKRMRSSVTVEGQNESVCADIKMFCCLWSSESSPCCLHPQVLTWGHLHMTCFKMTSFYFFVFWQKFWMEGCTWTRTSSCVMLIPSTGRTLWRTPAQITWLSRPIAAALVSIVPVLSFWSPLYYLYYLNKSF